MPCQIWTFPLGRAREFFEEMGEVDAVQKVSSVFLNGSLADSAMARISTLYRYARSF
jgi:hypothetical protein